MTAKPNVYIFSGGGSGGHLYPGLAIARALRDLQAGTQITFLTTERPIDADILKRHDWQFQSQPVIPIPKKPWKLPGFYHRWKESLMLCRRIIREKDPAAVLGLGGYASVCALKIAAKQNIPTACLNCDSLPGKANRYGAKYCRKIFLQWSVAASHFGKDKEKCLATGAPVRHDFSRLNRPSAVKLLKLDPRLQTLVIMGGSLGGHTVNLAALQALTEPATPPHKPILDPQSWQILHLTGPQDALWVQEQYDHAGLSARTLPFAERMDMVMAVADLVVARAGASTLAELTTTARPSILLPYPHHRDQHQYHNASVLARGGAAEIVNDEPDSTRTARNLAGVLGPCLADPQRRRQMAQAAADLAKPNAASHIAQLLIRMAKVTDDSH